MRPTYARFYMTCRSGTIVPLRKASAFSTPWLSIADRVSKVYVAECGVRITCSKSQTGTRELTGRRRVP